MLILFHMMNTIFIWVPLSLLLLLITSLLLKPKKLLHNKNNLTPPSPPKLPLLGHLHLLGSLPHRSLWKLSKKHGPIMLLKFGSVPTVVISSAAAAKEMFKLHDLASCTRPRLAATRRFTYNFLDLNLSPYGHRWRELRKICILELFSAKRVQSFRHIREEEVGLLLNSISESSCSSTPIDLKEKSYSLTASVTTRMAFGKRFRWSELDNENFQGVIQRASEVLGSFSATDFFPGFGWIVDRVSGVHGRLEKSFAELDAFFQQVVDDRINFKANSQNEENIVDVLLRMERESSESDALEKLQYLKMVVKEVLRLHPPVPLLLPRETMYHFKLNGYDIDPKVHLHVNTWAIGRDPESWTNPEEFFPERFMESNIDYKGQNFELITFGAGRRICPGVNMGIVTVELALANMLLFFDWKLPNGMKEEDVDMEEAAGIAVSKKSPLKLVPIHYFDSD